LGSVKAPFVTKIARPLTGPARAYSGQTARALFPDAGRITIIRP
jgi:hypothetical protein